MLLNEVQKQNLRLGQQERLIADLMARLAALEANATHCGDN
jgi:hypothetical protein